MEPNIKTKKEHGNGIINAIMQDEKTGLVIALIVVVAIFATLNKNYLTRDNVVNILIAMSLAGMVAVGETYLMIAGHMDLSCGSVAAFSGVLAAKLLTTFSLPTPVTLLVVVLVGGTIGMINALLVTMLKFNHFIATLATQSIFRGFAFILCDGKSIFIKNQTFIKLGVTRVLGIPVPVIIFLIVMLSLGVVLARTRFGRSVYMIGGNPTAARLAGMDEKKVKTILFSMTAALSALGGALLASRMNSGQPSACEGLEFEAITGAVLGGVALQGGIGSMTGCLIGLLIMTGFNNGLQVLNVQTFWQDVASGLLLIVALTFDYYRNLQREKIKK